MHLAGAGRRFLAFLVDMFLIGIIVFAICFRFFGLDVVFKEYQENRSNVDCHMRFELSKQMVNLVSYVIWLVLSCFMDCSKYQGTPGKRMLNIRVVTGHSERISFGQSIIRNFFKLFSTAFFGLGLLSISFSKDQQGWHDMISKCFVIRD
ncbi:MAG: RDD family protein [Candidatus Omnitrophica bacterium]|nr:RDD family protein [Candidatus Omnitrophota bacterium]